MTLSDKICDDNAESIGQPLFDRYMLWFINSDYSGLVNESPKIEESMPRERFDKKIEYLKPLGKPISNKYLARLNHIDYHDLYWKVRYESQQDILWKLSLAEVDGKITPIGMEFGTVYKAPNTKVEVKSVDYGNHQPNDNLLLETVIRLHEKSDYKEYLKKFPEIEGREYFDEAVDNLKPVGRMKSIEYLTRLNKPNHHILAWKVQYEKEDEDLLWELHLAGSDGHEKLVGLGFSR